MDETRSGSSTCKELGNINTRTSSLLTCSRAVCVQYDGLSGAERNCVLRQLSEDKRLITPHPRPQPLRRLRPHIEMEITLVMRPLLLDADALRPLPHRNLDQPMRILARHLHIDRHAVDMGSSPASARQRGLMLRRSVSRGNDHPLAIDVSDTLQPVHEGRHHQQLVSAATCHLIRPEVGPAPPEAAKMAEVHEAGGGRSHRVFPGDLLDRAAGNPGRAEHAGDHGHDHVPS